MVPVKGGVRKGLQRRSAENRVLFFFGLFPFDGYLARSHFSQRSYSILIFTINESGRSPIELSNPHCGHMNN